jgi:hypothetical protein
MHQKFVPLVSGTALVNSNANKKSPRPVFFLLALSATILLWMASAEAADINISNPDPRYPATPAETVGWDPGMTHARAIHWAYDGAPEHSGNYGWYQYWGSCPDDSGGCSQFSVTDPPSPQWQAQFDVFGQITPCRPNTGEPLIFPDSQYNSLPCPLYANWYGAFGTSGAKSYSAGVNNYSWNKWNSPNIFNGIAENMWRSSSLNGRRLDNAFLSFTLTAYLSRTLVQNGVSPRGQGRITIGFTFFGADDPEGTHPYIVEMTLSNMRVNLNDHRITSDYSSGAVEIPVSNPWRDDIWAEAITPDENTPPHTWVIGARNWGFNLIEGQPQTIFFDPWWVATTLLYPPADCPKMLDRFGSPTASYDDFAGYGFVPCGNRASLTLPRSALFDANDQPAARLESFYVGVEMAGTAVNGSASIYNWKIQTRW